MSKDATTPSGRAALDAELAGFQPRTVTVRLCDALLKNVPGAPELAGWTSVEQALAHEGLDGALAERVAALCDEDAVDRALFAARSIDTGDTGITILTGVRTALSLFLGDKGPGAGAASQQRADAALKALGVATLATRLIPREPAQRVAILEALPAGRALLLMYAAVEVALPFGAEAASGHFVADLVQEQSKRIAARLLGVIGRKGVADAQKTLAALVGTLDRLVVQVHPHAGGLAEALKDTLPAVIGSRAGALTDVVAAGADALPLYRYLGARLAVESRIGLARWEADPTSEPQPAPEPVPEPAVPEASALPPPPAVPAGLASRSLGADPLHPVDPLTEPAAEAREPESAVPVADPPGEHDLSGVYQRAMPWGVIWLVFTRDGVFSNHPPAHPEADWVAHAEAGHQVGTYQHRGETLEIRWPGGKTTTSTLGREATALTVDGARCQRCDWNLDGHRFRGRWVARDGDETLELFESGRFEGTRGQGHLALGVGAVAFETDEGRTVVTLYSTLEPDSARPDTLWIAGKPWDRAVDAGP